jgi:predicted nucleic acid-binding protein
VILVDSNIPMYLVGKSHPHKIDAQRILERCIAQKERLVTDAEVLQEVLQRYVAIDRRDAIQPVFDVLLGIAEEVFPVTGQVVARAREIVLGAAALSARDAVHVAVMEQHRIRTIMTFDQGFDAYPGIERISN